jgi:phytoene dehydrogenase-like protein
VTRSRYDVVVIGSGPNGLASAVATARAGLHTLVVEAKEAPGGGMRTAALTAPGFLHDVCSSVHPLAAASPWFRRLALDELGLQWIQPPAPVAHVLAHGRVAMLERSLDDTAAQLGRDGRAYRDLLAPYVEHFDALLDMILAPLRPPAHPVLLARFGLDAIHSMRVLARRRFRGEEAGALLAGIAAHAMIPLENLASASFGLVLAIAGHAVGWPLARGGSRAIGDALVARLRQLGGELALDTPITTFDQLPPARAYMFDVTPRQLLAIAGDRLPSRYRARLARFRYGPGVFKMDWALRAPVPWTDPQLARTATVHLSGSVDELARAEHAVHHGRLPERPFVLFVQPTLFDPSRAPPGMHVAWAYCHVPHASPIDASEAIESHIESFAPGFRDVIVERATKNAIEIEQYNANYVGGDINGGISDLRQLFFRPIASADPYATPTPNIFICSSSTPPGGGVHGMCGYWAARSVLHRVFGRQL